MQAKTVKNLCYRWQSKKWKSKKIRKEIIKNIKNPHCLNIGNRSNAIKIAIQKAEPNEIILVAGKGHETEQIYKNKTFSISDKKIIKKIHLKKNFKKKFELLKNKRIAQNILNNKRIGNFNEISIDSRTVKKITYFWLLKAKIITVLNSFLTH